MNMPKPISQADLPAIKAALEGRYIYQLRMTSPGSIVTSDYQPHRLWVKCDDEGVVRDVVLG